MLTCATFIGMCTTGGSDSYSDTIYPIGGTCFLLFNRMVCEDLLSDVDFPSDGGLPIVTVCGEMNKYNIPTLESETEGQCR